jgi:hypothetical protein
VAFRKGHVITEEDIPSLLSMGKEISMSGSGAKVMLHEDEAAGDPVASVQSDNIRSTDPKEGKVELFAETDGLLKIDTDRWSRSICWTTSSLRRATANFPVQKRGTSWPARASFPWSDRGDQDGTSINASPGIHADAGPAVLSQDRGASSPRERDFSRADSGHVRPVVREKLSGI